MNRNELLLLGALRARLDLVVGQLMESNRGTTESENFRGNSITSAENEFLTSFNWKPSSEKETVKYFRSWSSFGYVVMWIIIGMQQKEKLNKYLMKLFARSSARIYSAYKYSKMRQLYEMNSLKLKPFTSIIDFVIRLNVCEETIVKFGVSKQPATLKFFKFKLFF